MQTIPLGILVLAIVYHLLHRCYSTPKERSWILTTFTSGLMTLCALPFLAQLTMARGDFGVVRSKIPEGVSIFQSRIFQAYLISDLTLGSIYYRKHISLATGWVHHILYVFIVEYCIHAHYSHIFSIGLLMELPTFVLGLGSLHPAKFRNTIIFATTFFATRIVFHAGLITTFLLPFGIGRRSVQGSLVPGGIFVAAFPMHCMWFVGCIKGFIRRAKARHALVPPIIPTPAVTTPQTIPLTRPPLLRSLSSQSEITHPLPVRIIRLVPLEERQRFIAALERRIKLEAVVRALRGARARLGERRRSFRRSFSRQVVGMEGPKPTLEDYKAQLVY